MSYSPAYSNPGNVRDFTRVNPDDMREELNRYRHQTEWLSVMNELHGRLSGAVDLPGMVEGFSIWLMPFVEHDLLAYKNHDRKREHSFCSCHGPDRRRVMKVAEKMSRNGFLSLDADCLSENGFYIQGWDLGSHGGDGSLLLVRKEGCLESYESYMVGKAIEVLAVSLRRALDYEDLFDLASKDALTGLKNRRVFEERIGPMLESAKRHNHSICLVCMDLDRFKQINDTLGHAEGDEVLKKIARTLSSMVRSEDLLVRMGGDEFTLVLPNTDLAAAENLAARLCSAVDRLNIVTPTGIKVGISIGLVQWKEGMGKDEWFQYADESLYRAKALGRSRVSVHRHRICTRAAK
ncbi:MAG: GGDEF domain-containing protein [Desulfobulbaceae bacterium]|nr:GGDEF domain-containing protein [Desulfobulbaceae bacterium]